jgi:outer membrane lipoprotein SlyB
VQQANKTDQGIVVGVRQVDVKVSSQTGAVAGAAAGGVIGGSLPGSATGQALGTVGGGLLGGLLGSSVEQAAGDTKAWEYIVRKRSGELVSVTQTGEVPLVVGQRVLVIAGVQARIVPDYTVDVPDDHPVKKPAEAATPILTAPAAPVPDADSKPAVPPTSALPLVVLPAASNAETVAEKLFAPSSANGSDPVIPIPLPTVKPKE